MFSISLHTPELVCLCFVFASVMMVTGVLLCFPFRLTEFNYRMLFLSLLFVMGPEGEAQVSQAVFSVICKEEMSCEESRTSFCKWKYTSCARSNSYVSGAGVRRACCRILPCS